jgi:sugar phosphate isomerase/epimerase
MPASHLHDLSHCAIHTMTNKPWSLQQCVDAYAGAGVGGISVWRNVIEPIGAKEAARIIRSSGLKVPALVRGGFFVAKDESARQAAFDVNRTCVDEAHDIGAEMIVLVVGAVPGIPLDESRKQVADGIAAVLPHARGAGIKLAIEPLHPMYAGDKSCVNRTADARRICEQLRDPLIGIALDVYHTWWDPDLKSEIAKAGEQGTLFGFHVCDWRLDTRHLLTDRGLMGDGCIEIKTIRGWVEDAGFRGFNEVEVFSEEYWASDQAAYVKKICRAYLENT